MKIKSTPKKITIFFILHCTLFSLLLINIVHSESLMNKSSQESEKIYSRYKNLKTKEKKNIYNYGEDECKSILINFISTV